MESLTIGELAARSGVAPSALRYYERLGLIRAGRTGGNQRRYERAELRRVAFIRIAAQIGVPLEEIKEALDGRAEVVYGNRTFGSHSSFSFWYVMGNRGVTTAANMLYNCYLGDLETCFKLMPLELYRSLDVKSKGFGMEAEVTGKLLRRGIRPFEVPISYRARTREEGKKITWRDGVQALWILGRERTRKPRIR